jgi:hypothetical protein
VAQLGAGADEAALDRGRTDRAAATAGRQQGAAGQQLAAREGVAHIFCQSPP